jgi:hypothetical protein
VKGLDLRQEPRSELPEENGGGGRVRDEAGGEWVDNDGGGTGGGRTFEIQEEETEGRRWGWGKKRKKKRKQPAGQGGTGNAWSASGRRWLPRVWNSYSIPRV